MAKQVVYERTDGRWGWRLVATNGNIIATDGGQGYENESEARRMRNAVVGGDYADADKRRQPL